jgi:hypothetical protein
MFEEQTKELRYSVNSDALEDIRLDRVRQYSETELMLNIGGRNHGYTPGLTPGGSLLPAVL